MVESINDLSKNTSITRLSPGGFARAILESINRRISEAYDVFDLNLARAFVSSAPGQYLELIGALLGVTRLSSAAASVDQDTQVIKFYVSSGTFGSINNSNNITIPQGTILSTEDNNGGVQYRTIQTHTLVAGQSTAWVAAEAIVPGEDANVGSKSLVFHSFTNYSDSDNKTLLVTNVYPIANGKNFESDENFRFRIVNRVLESEAANIVALRLAALTTPGVADIVVIPRYKGIGTFGLIIKSTLPTVSQTLIDNVTANIYNVQAFGDIAYVKGPKETGFSFRTTIHYDQRLPDDELKMIEDDLETNVTEYVNNLDIGESLAINRMVAELFSINAHIANIGESGRPLEEVYIYNESRLEDNRVRRTLLGDYVPESDERIIIEPSIDSPIIFDRAYTRR
jgi:uncharacterized phage protein gp47/JayE